MKKYTSLGDLARELKMNKSKLAYYFGLGLIKPTSTVSGMNIYDSEKTTKRIRIIEEMQAKGKTLKDIKESMK